MTDAMTAAMTAAMTDAGTAVLVWLRLDVRRRLRSLAVLALLVAVASGTVLTAVAGARRGESALPRLAERTLPATAAVLPNEPGFDWDRIRALPEVEALTAFGVGTEPQIDEVTGANGGFLPADAELLRTIERPVVLEGRVNDPDRPDEAVVTPGFVRHYGLGVGDTVTMRLHTPEQTRSGGLLGDLGEPGGPTLRIRIVGEIRTVWFSGALFGKEDVAIMPSPAVLRRYRANVFNPEVHYLNALVRLRGGESALPAFERHLAEVTGRPDIDVWNMPEKMRDSQRSFTFQARCLLAFGLAALAASLVLVGQTVARYTAATVADLHVMRALGMTTRQAVLAAAAGPFLAALAGASVGAAGAGVASRWFPIGTAAKEEPTPGIYLDGAVLGTGWVLVVLVVLAGSAAASRLFLTADRRASGNRRSSIAAAAARTGMPVPVVVGTRFALEAGQGRTAVPVRPALLGGIAGVLGVLAAFTFSSGVSDAATNPQRFGQTWQLETFAGANGFDFLPAERTFRQVASDRDVAGVNDARVAVAHADGSDAAVTLFSLRPYGAPLRVVLTRGRLPQGPAEVVLGPQSAAAAGAQVGGRVRFETSAGARELTVVGTGFLPTSPHNDYDSGGLLTNEGYDALFAGTPFKFHLAQVTLRPGADVAAVRDRLTRQVATALGGDGLALDPPAPPAPITELRQVRMLPAALGVFLALLALGAVGHALATAVRRRRHDVAVLRALGMTRWQSRGVVVTQATVLTVVGLAFGIPLGVALGRAVWRVVADYTPLYYVPPLAVWALLLVGPLALLVANLLAAWPGQQAARLRIGHALRAE